MCVFSRIINQKCRFCGIYLSYFITFFSKGKSSVGNEKLTSLQSADKHLKQMKGKKLLALANIYSQAVYKGINIKVIVAKLLSDCGLRFAIF